MLGGAQAGAAGAVDLDRTEGLLTDEQAREMRITAELGLDADAKITALRLRWDVNLGAYVSGRSGWPVGNIGGTLGYMTSRRSPQKPAAS